MFVDNYYYFIVNNNLGTMGMLLQMLQTSQTLLQRLVRDSFDLGINT